MPLIQSSSWRRNLDATVGLPGAPWHSLNTSVWMVSRATVRCRCAGAPTAMPH